MKHKHLYSRIVAVTLGAVALSACLPAHLQKYRKDAPTTTEAPRSASPVSGDLTPLGPDADVRRPSSGNAPAAANAQHGRATIYAVDKQTFRFQLREADVWDTALNVLMRNYNLTIVDRANGVITTEWDSYFLDDAVFRNKVSIRLRPNGRGFVDVSVHNNVERLRDAAQTTGTVGAVWLPAEDSANEVSRIVQNMALIMNQPPPVLPPSAVAKGAKGQDSETTR